MVDLVIRDTLLVDGSGRDAARGDLAVVGDRIAAIGHIGERGTVEVDGRGLALAPGFIDLHTHYDCQLFWDPQASPSPPVNPVCARLESQLAAFDRGANDPARAEQIRKYEEAAANQQNELSRQQAQARRLNCDANAFFVLFSGGQNPQCGPLNSKISQMRGNINSASQRC